MFDTENFLNQTVEGKLDTETPVVPEGEYPAHIEDVKARTTQNGSVIMDVTWTIDDPAVAETVGIQNPRVRQSIFLDVTESGALDTSKGKNVALGRLRSALGQNTEGAWSPAQLLGQSAKVRVSHRVYEGKTYADVKGVAPLS